MPPKKKKGGKKKDKEELSLDEKYKKSMKEIDALKLNLEFRKEQARQAEHKKQATKVEIKRVESSLEECADTSKVISNELTRQYKGLETEMGIRLYQTELELTKTKDHLTLAQKELKDAQDEARRTIDSKNHEIYELKNKLNQMEKIFNQIFQGSMNTIQAKLTEAENDWEAAASRIHSKHKQRLLDLGIHPIGI